MTRKTTSRLVTLVAALRATAAIAEPNEPAQSESEDTPRLPTTPPPQAEETLPDLNLPSLDGPDVSPRGPRLEVYGFADVNYAHALFSKSNPWANVTPSYPSFSVGNINLYLDTALSERVRSLIEVRFLYSPHGNRTIDDSGREEVTDTGLMDPTEAGRRIQWGGILIERAWIEYDLHRYVTVRAGSFLTPFGIWNVDHGSPTLIGIRRPFIIRDGLFPERQSGIELHGSFELARFRIGYHLTLSNGRGVTSNFEDLDNNKAIGGRLYVHDRGIVDAKLGVSFFRGRNTERTYRWFPTDDLPERDQVALRQRDELGLAADLRLEWKGLLFQSEYVAQERAFTDEGRTLAEGQTNRFSADGRRWGLYGLLGYRTSFFGVMPYASLEYYRPDPTGGPLVVVFGRIYAALVTSVGLNVRPVPDVVLKLEFGRVDWPSRAPGSYGDHPLQILQAQVAWAF